jgi:hypothetical protein
MKWVMVSGPYGTYPTLHYRQTSIQAGALDAVSKRVQDGQKVNFQEMFDGFKKQLEEAIASGNYA